MSSATKASATKTLSKDQKKLKDKLDALQKELETPAVFPRRERFRDVYDWSTKHTATACSVFSLDSVTATLAPIVKLVLGFAILSAVRRLILPEPPCGFSRPLLYRTRSSKTPVVVLCSDSSTHMRAAYVCEGKRPLRSHLRSRSTTLWKG